MSGVTTFTTTSSPVRRLVSPLSSAKSRNIAKGATTTNDYGCQREDELASNSHGFTRSNISTPRVDSCILGKVTVEQRDKFTLYKIEVNDGEKSWIIYRRYKEFVLLNKKLRRLYPQFRLSLPERRIFKNNFAKDFIERRQRGLEEFSRNLFHHCDLASSDVVQRFYRLCNPPQPSENFEASRNFCLSLERQLADLQQKFRDQSVEYNAVKGELAQIKCQKEENQGPANVCEQKQDDLAVTIKNLEGQLAIALENEKKAQEELEVLKEEMNAERASVQATRVIEKQKRELAVDKQIEDFNKSKEALDKRIDSLAAAMGQLPKVQVEIAGRKLEVDASDGMSENAAHLQRALNDSRSQLEKIHLNALEMYKREEEDLKTECHRAALVAKARVEEVESLKAQMSDLQKRYQDAVQKYFYSLVIGMKLNMAVCGYPVDHINHFKPQKLFEQVRNLGLSIEHWPSWLSRELSTASATPADNEDEEE
ncbi:uncharacterized protein LOC141876281 isoform X2 [Acropora palmata]|uniref:uncharacterized protein LOC141876281 isoform X2 n=1 Tax=Acropora palmata TaxID=6131 RepID=UPI003DA19D2F